MGEFEKSTTVNTDEGRATYDFISREREQAANLCVTYTPYVFVCGRQIADWRELEDLLMSYLDGSR